MPGPAVFRKSLSGFTLLEVQIALLLLVLILGLLSGALYMASKSWRSGQIENEHIEQKRLISSFLRRQISQIHPLFWSGSRDYELIFRGQNDAMVYVGSLPASAGAGQLSLLELAITGQGANKRLELGYIGITPDQSPFDTIEDMKRSPLLYGIESLHFSYFGRQKEGRQAPTWHDRWENSNLLPQLIRCTIILTNGNRWPELIMPLHTDDVSSLVQYQLKASQNTGLQLQNVPATLEQTLPDS